VALDTKRWGAVQRVHSKETWLAKQEVKPPWPLRENVPTVVSFYSYKGGVGRSTLVAVVAALLARQGANVVIVDLDLEAPGQQSLFELTPERGVLDFLIEHAAIGHADAKDVMRDVTASVPGATGKVYVVPAGAMGWSYVEKVARLDFSSHTESNESTGGAVHDGLRALLKGIRGSKNPDWVLLDARTGIHDLGGLAIHALAHID